MKRVLLVCIAIVLGLSLCACSNAASSADAGGSQISDPSSQTHDTTMATAEGEDAKITYDEKEWTVTVNEFGNIFNASNKDESITISLAHED